MTRFQKVVEELDRNTHVEDIAEVQQRLDRIVEVNATLRERVNKAAQVFSPHLPSVHTTVCSQAHFHKVPV